MKIRSKKKLRSEFIGELKDSLYKQTSCSIQHDGWPCNTCFHHWAEKTLGLNYVLSHWFWGIVFSLRGDYDQDVITSGQIENILSPVKETRKQMKNEKHRMHKC